LRERILIWTAALVAFGGCLGGTFVFDDFALLNDPSVASPSGWWECWRLTQTRPLTWFTFWMNFQLGGENPAGYHAVNLAAHLAVAALVWEVLRRLIPERAALAAAAIFAVHPLIAEPVNYVFARPILLTALFSLLAIRSWILERLWAAAAWFALAMLAKEECAALPLFLVLLDVSRGLPTFRVQRKLWPLAAMFGIALVLGLRVVWAAAVTPGAWAGMQAGISPLGYLAAQGPVILRYLRMLVVPWGFSVDYDAILRPVALARVAWAAVVVLAGVACLRFRELRAGFWFLAGLLLLAPSSSIFPASDLATDRRMYLPLIAFSACAGLLLQSVDRRMLAGIVVAFALISVHYTNLWRNPEALWSEAARRAPGKLRPMLQLARTLPPDRAMAVLEQAQRLAPQDSAVPAEQGRILLSMGRAPEALGAFGRALALAPNDAQSLNNRGAVLAALGQSEAAHADFERALGRDPCLFDARLNLAHLGIRTPDPLGRCRYTLRQKEMLER
jgi:tetratricopeptide (TPR) repeat protein